MDFGFDKEGTPLTERQIEALLSKVEGDGGEVFQAEIKAIRQNLKDSLNKMENNFLHFILHKRVFTDRETVTLRVALSPREDKLFHKLQQRALIKSVAVRATATPLGACLRRPRKGRHILPMTPDYTRITDDVR
jgi:hypothetical protein